MRKTILPKKAQMEIMGLAIIIVLLMVGLLFYVMYSINKGPATLKKTFKEKETIANFANSMTMTTITECNNARMEQLFIDCMNDGVITIRCDPMLNMQTCEDLKTFINNSFVPSTLKKWNMVYTIRFEDGAGAQVFNITHSEEPELVCINANVGKTYSKLEKVEKIIPLGSGQNMFVEIELCS